MATGPEPPRECPLCPRLVAYRAANRAQFGDWFNAPVPSFGDPAARLAIVGLAPGLRGANRTGRPFTGDYAGELLYSTLSRFGLASGDYRASPDDGLALQDAFIVNAVRCAPPDNKPTPLEIETCRGFLAAQLAALPNARAIIALGRVAHESVVRCAGRPLAAAPFAHGAIHTLPRFTLFDSYHCSRYNTNTGRLTEAMFHAVFASALAWMQASA
ncbi:MAG: uracil-DNA glycosylase [Hyphomicrobiales bacterium]|nr:uracil-DNA glycosylase [Hyphomicrobiales bacterium]